MNREAPDGLSLAVLLYVFHEERDLNKFLLEAGVS
jgi:hypothetical protein